ncbi:hypothetical protein M427DRAFT_136074 [Gonapodya prolifera JEL478]|uniref:MOSC domain-containing protein n=1 Tax=Gonapodya prolifera (strain JEL478) TaxID=1344416 RepID=A0A139AAY0_GONPJ|nr:hypothetical protein M427DRAFT_136074 [Gonapodya prolifera JEL478]|eukprot:KXS13982.1 hypothetical protein M427DRAFT_136074 [Gonapodya prolifera JEL478]
MRIAQLFVYPVKSCKGIALQEARLDDYSLEFDRMWLLTEGWLVLKAPGVEEELRVRFPREPSQDDSSYPAVVFEESVWAFDEGEEASTWLSKYLYPLHGVRLCVKDTATPRYSDRKYSPDDLKGWSQTAFPDLTPLLVCTAASIPDFDRLIHARNPDLPTLDTLNVRPNIVVEGCYAYAEDRWKVVTLHGCRLMIRCQMPCVDHVAGKMDRTWTTLKTLMSYRHGVDKGVPWQACFALGMAHAKECVGRTVRVGDFVEVVEEGDFESAE